MNPVKPFRPIRAAAAILAILLAAPTLLRAQESANKATSAPAASPVRLALVAEKKTVTLGPENKPVVRWQEMGGAAAGRVVVLPGDTIRYTVRAENTGKTALPGFALTQPVPAGTRYVLDSATDSATDDVRPAFSIDGARHFSARPMVTVTLPGGRTETRPAPADAYTHVRWTLTKPLAPAVPVVVAYQVCVR